MMLPAPSGSSLAASDLLQPRTGLGFGELGLGCAQSMSLETPSTPSMTSLFF